jgi:hypothetical protein
MDGLRCSRRPRLRRPSTGAPGAGVGCTRWRARAGRPGPVKNSGHVVGTTTSGLTRQALLHRSDLGLLGGRDRRRSGDLALFRRALCQLSYPTAMCGAKFAGGDRVTWWRT